MFFVLHNLLTQTNLSAEDRKHKRVEIEYQCKCWCTGIKVDYLIIKLETTVHTPRIVPVGSYRNTIPKVITLIKPKRLLPRQNPNTYIHPANVQRNSYIPISSYLNSHQRNEIPEAHSTESTPLFMMPFSKEPSSTGSLNPSFLYSTLSMTSRSS